MHSSDMRLSYVVLAALAVAFLPTPRAQAQTCVDIPNCDSCPNPTICDACQTGRFFVVPAGGSPTCQTCTVCQANEVEVSPCSPFIDRQCAPVCPAGTIDVGGSCQDCGVFDCATCSAPGTCTECASGYFLDAGQCVACTVCPAGQYASTACSASADASCAACGAGAISATAGAVSCTPCDSGLEPNATATECISVCGNGTITGAEACDDGNTVDGDGCSATCTAETGWTCTGTIMSDCRRNPPPLEHTGGACSAARDGDPALAGLFFPVGMVCFVLLRRRRK